MKRKAILQKAGILAFAVMVGTGSVATSMALSPAEVYAQTSGAPVSAEQMQSETITVIDEKTSWNYLDDNTDPAKGLESKTAWTGGGFDDGAWKKAAGKFGAKRGELKPFDGFTPTVLLNQYKPDDDKVNVPTFFFRTNIEIKNVSELTSITGTLFHDDAVAVYLNGHLIKSVDMPTEEHEDNMFYAGVSAGAPKQADINLSKEDIAKYVKEGSNTVSVELHNDRETSSDLYFEFQNMALNYNEQAPAPQEITQKSVFLTVGSDTTSQRLTWYADTDKVGEVQYAEKKGDSFPADFKTKQADSAIASNDKGFYSNQAVLENLKPNTEYVYRLVNEGKISETYTFRSGDNNGSFRFSFVGDPQMGAGSLPSDTEGWNQTVDVIQNKLGADFLLSAGDQVNTASNESQYAAYLNPAFASLPSATTIGNHDAKSEAYNQHFNLPNESIDKGASTAGTDYWFVYENTLFMDINSCNMSTAEHKAFMEEAIRQNPDVKWKTVVFHHSVYSTASHTDDKDIIQRRNELPNVFKELDIDVVLMGHDHVYTRTYVMDGTTPQRTEKVESSTVNPDGTVYLTGNSASGSKYYDIAAPNAEFSAKMDQSKRRTVTDVQVTDSSYTMTTYFADNMEVLDTFTIHKTDSSKLSALIEEIAKKDFVENDYTEESWKNLETALESAKKVLDNKEAHQDEINKAHDDLKLAAEGLEKKPLPKPEGGDQSQGGDSQDDNKKPEGSQKPGDSQKPENTEGNGASSGAQNTDKDKADEVIQTGDMTDAAAASMILLASGATAAALIKKRKNAKSE